MMAVCVDGVWIPDEKAAEIRRLKDEAFHKRITEKVSMVCRMLGRHPEAGSVDGLLYEAFGFVFFSWRDRGVIVKEIEPRGEHGQPGGRVWFHWHANPGTVVSYVPGDWEEVLSAAMSEASRIMHERHTGLLTARISEQVAGFMNRWGIDLPGPYQGFTDQEVQAAIQELRGFGWTVSEIDGYPGLWWIGHATIRPFPREQTTPELMGGVEVLREERWQAFMFEELRLCRQALKAA
jgi:hypothetical protein